MKKGCLIAVASVVILIGVVIALVFWLTGDAVASAEQFLSLVSEGKVEEAYQLTASGFRSQQDAASFAAVVEQIGLDRYQAATWSTRSVENSQATLEGTVRTTDGGTIPLTLQLVKEGGHWRILSLRSPQGGASVSGSGRQLPADTQLLSLTDTAMAEFNQALLSKDFTSFYAFISTRWREQTSPQQLRDAFQELLERNIHFSGLQGVAAVFEQAPRIDENGLLLLSGYYPSTPVHVKFDLKYIYEHPDWKLFGIHVATEPAGAEEDIVEAEPDTGESAQTSPPDSSREGEASAYYLTQNVDLTGRLGRLLVAFPSGSSPSGTNIEVFPAGGDKRSTSSYGSLNADLLPGLYDVVISGRRLTNVEVRSGQDTQIRVGVLRVKAGSGTQTKILASSDTGEAVVIASAYGNHEFGLPVGSYQVEIAGQTADIEVVEGQIIDF